MLFNSYIFLLGFFPVTLCGFYLLQASSERRYEIIWLVLASFVFFGWWNPELTFLLAFSVVFNFVISDVMTRRNSGGVRVWLIIGVAGNLALLGYFKYANFFVTIVNDVSGSNWHLAAIILPIGLSFFTFQQIAYIVDVHKGHRRETGFFRYALFVTFFPQLIAGPIVHHTEMMPQFARQPGARRLLINLAVGMSIFTLGLAKKVLIADSLAPFVTPVHAAGAEGVALSFFEAWVAVVVYPFQLYFDFSGYSDMAIGLGRMFGIVLPANFNSPYKATNIAEFWQRWHISLTRFLSDYVYEPVAAFFTAKTLARKRNSLLRFGLALALPTILTFFLSGLWHGAGWNFIIFGLLHGTYVI